MATESCMPYKELLSDFAEGELEGTDLVRAEGHLQECACCRAEVALLKGIVSNLRQIREEEVPAALATSVMGRVLTEPIWSIAWRTLTAPLAYTPVRIFAPAAAVILLLFVIRPYLPVEIRIEHGPTPVATDLAAVRPIWWGGDININDQAHSSSEVGRLALHPGDAIRTPENVELTMTLGEAAIDLRARSSLILKTDGVYLASGKIQVRIETTHPGSPKPGQFKVTTPNATIVHLGTVFGVTYAKQTTRVHVLQGKVKLTSVNGTSLEAGTGQYVSVEPDSIVQSGPLVEPAATARIPRSQPEDVREITPRPRASGSGR